MSSATLGVQRGCCRDRAQRACPLTHRPLVYVAGRVAVAAAAQHTCRRGSAALGLSLPAAAHQRGRMRTAPGTSAWRRACSCRQRAPRSVPAPPAASRHRAAFDSKRAELDEEVESLRHAARTPRSTLPTPWPLLYSVPGRQFCMSVALVNLFATGEKHPYGSPGGY